jgi:hypothetical protein
MKIVFLGWGSLVWCPCDLKKRGEWYSDGPCLPVEFARISKNKRLTLVLYPDADRVQVLWAYAEVNNLDEAIESLRKREKAPTQCQIGFVLIKEDKNHCQVVPEILDEIKSWAENKKLDAIVWTDLPSNFEGKIGKELNENNAIEYLKSLQGEELQKARKYIEKAPLQIRTKFRPKIEEALDIK